MEHTGKLPVSGLNRILDSLLNLVFPEGCLICAAPVVHRKNRGVCPGCLLKAHALRIPQPICPSCGLPLPNFKTGSNVLCVQCILDPPVFSGARSFGYYSAELAGLIHGLKFHKRKNLAEILVPFMVETFYASWKQTDFDLVLPVPLHTKRRRDRGYNQSELLARSLALRVDIPFSDSLLIRTRSTSSQVGLSDLQRRENVRNAFRCADPGRTAGRRILLIDDVMTTGATAKSTAQALIRGGALRVSVLTLARTEK